MPQVGAFFLGGMGWAAGGALATGAATAGAYAAGATIAGSIAVRLLTSVALTALSSALAKPDAPKPAGLRSSATGRGDTNPDGFVMGRYATAGTHACPPYTHRRSGHKTPNPYLQYVVNLGGAPGQQMVGITIDGRTCTIEGEELPWEGEFGTGGANNWEGKLREYGRAVKIEGVDGTWAWVRYYDGTQTVADERLINRYGEHPDRPWTAEMVGEGICYAIVTFQLHQGAFSGFPQVNFVLDGIPLYDPRMDSSVGGDGAQRWGQPATYAKSENPAVQIYNLLRGVALPGGAVYGGRATAAQLPLSNWIAAMDACDVAVGLEDGTAEAAWRTSYEVLLADEPASVIEELARAASIQLTESGGTWRIRVGAPAVPVAWLTDDDIISTIAQTFEMFPGLDETHNGVSISFPDPESGWVAAEAPLYTRSDYEAEDAGKQLVADLSLPAAPYANQVQRLARAYVEEERRFRRHVVTLPPDYGALEPLDTLAWSSGRNGYVDKVFEISATTTDPVTQFVSATLRERDPADYDWEPSFQLPYSPMPPKWGGMPEVEIDGVGVTGIVIADTNGKARRPAIQIVWNADEMENLDGIEWELRLQNGDQVQRGSIADVASGRLVISEGIIPAQAYQVRVRAVGKGYDLLWSDWATVVTPDVRIVLEDLAQEIEDSFREIAAEAGVETVTEFPIDPRDDQIVLKMPEAVLYRWDGEEWTTALYAGIPDGAIDLTKFAQGIEPVTIHEGASLPTGKLTEAIIWNGKLYRWSGAAYTAAVPAADVTGELTNDQIKALAAAKLTGQITAPQIADNAVTTAKIAAQAIDAGKLANQAVTAQKLADLAVTGAKIADAAISTGKIADAAILAGKLANGAVTSDKLDALAVTMDKVADSAITTAKIAAQAVDAGKLANQAVTGQKLADLAVTGAKVADAAISTGKIADGAVLAGKIASGAVSGDKIADAAVSTAKFAAGIQPNTIVTGSVLPTVKSTDVIVFGGKLYRWSGSAYTAAVPAIDVTGQLTNAQIETLAAAKLTGQITGTQITDGAVTTAKVAAGAVTTAKLDALAVTADKIAANAITAAKVSAGAIEAAALAAGAVTADKVAANAITTGKIAAGAVSADQIAASAITASKLAVTDTANLVAASDFTDLTTWAISGGTATKTLGNDAWKTIDLLQITNSATWGQAASKVFAVTPESELHVAFRARNVSGTGGLQGRVVFYDDAAMNGGVVANVGYTASSSITDIVASIPVPANKSFARLMLINNGEAGSVAYFALPVVRRKNGGELIVDGAVSAVKIAANAITAAKIAAGAIEATAIASGAVTTAKLAAGAVTATEIASGAVTTGKLDALAVTSDKIAANAIIAAKVAAGAIEATAIASGAVTTGKLAAGAVTATEIASGAVTTVKLDALAVTADKIAANAIIAAKIAAGAIEATAIASGAVTTAKLAAGAVTATEIASGAVTTVKLDALAVTADKIAANAIIASKVSAGAIEAAAIAAGAVTTGKLDALAVTSAKIAASAIDATKIAAGAIEAVSIASAAVTTSKLDALAVTADKIAANAITAGKISAGAVETSALAANAVTSDKVAANSITAGKIAAAAVSAEQIAANAISASKLLLSDTTNYVVASDFQDLAAWDASGGVLARINGNAAWKTVDLLRITNTGTWGQASSKLFKVSPDSILQVAFRARNVAGSGGLQARIVFYDDAAMSNGEAVNIGYTASTSITDISASVTVPAAKNFARLMLINNGEAGSIAYFAIPTVRRKSEGELIVDGAITANKISAGAVTANAIAASAIVASKIASGAVTAEKINVTALSAITANIGVLTSSDNEGTFTLRSTGWEIKDSAGRVRVRAGKKT